MYFEKKHINSIKDCIDKGIEYIINNQDQEGFWNDFFIKEVGVSNQWVTGYIGHSLAGESLPKNSILKAINQLIITRLDSGGWGYNDKNVSDADSTANVINFMSSFNQKPIDTILLETLCDFLLTFQEDKTGGIMTYKPNDANIFAKSGWCKPEISVSAMTGITLFKVNKEKYKTAIDEIKKFVIQSQSSEGYWETYWWRDRMYGTNLACRFLYLIGEQHTAQKALQWVLDSYIEPNSFCKALALSTVLTDSYKIQTCDFLWDLIKWLIEEQNSYGYWTGDKILKLPNPYGNLAPWKRPCWIPTRDISDQNNLFTTATVIAALSELLEKISILE
jgi:squalene cyclase